jgi:hypothetical protein
MPLFGKKPTVQGMKSVLKFRFFIEYIVCFHDDDGKDPCHVYIMHHHVQMVCTVQYIIMYKCTCMHVMYKWCTCYINCNIHFLIIWFMLYISPICDFVILGILWLFCSRDYWLDYTILYLILVNRHHRSCHSSYRVRRGHAPSSRSILASHGDGPTPTTGHVTCHCHSVWFRECHVNTASMVMVCDLAPDLWQLACSVNVWVWQLGLGEHFIMLVHLFDFIPGLTWQ